MSPTKKGYANITTKLLSSSNLKFVVIETWKIYETDGDSETTKWFLITLQFQTNVLKHY